MSGISVNCVLSEWGDFNTCSVTCGGGNRTRTRSITTQAANGGIACGPKSESEECGTAGCPGK